ncbi:penicillin-binding transpeptidase domain-containing protein [Aeromicrobium phragmitis]|nr:penicillin-binding transpeptidase domain-containing protein [Aeromicrobium phragmitis]
MRKLLATGLLSSLVLSGCSLFSDRGQIEDLADSLAAALAEHSLADVPLTRDSDAERHEELVSPLNSRPVTVSVGEVTEEGDTASATLRWTWELGGQEWRYDTQAPLVHDGDRWQVDWSPALVESSLTDEDRLVVSSLAAQRGRVLGQGDLPVVEDRPVLRFGIDKTKVEAAQVGTSAERLAAMLDIDAAGYRTRVEGAGPQAFVEALVLRSEEASGVDPNYAAIPGAVALEDEMPLAPTRDFAAELLGRVGPATAEIIEKSEGRIQVGDVVGLSGLQAQYDEVLGGTPGVEVAAVGADGQRRQLFSAEPRDGEDLRTTLDAAMQQKAEAILAGAGEDAPPSALVAMRPSDGALLAAANGNGGLNIATTGQYAPGSTFKLVTALALLRSGVAPGDVIECPATINVDGRVFENYDDYPTNRLGAVSLTTAFANSCNTALIGARDRLDDTALTEAADALGLGRDHDLGFPSYFGQVPPPEGETEKAADVIGQGKVLASPMAMAAAAASVSAGHAVVPTLLPDYESTVDEGDAPALTEQEAQTLRDLLRAVVTDGSGAFLAHVPGDVGAKTGTAEYGEPGPDGKLATHAWMIAIQGDLAVAVFVEDGESGSGTAGPLLEAFLR